MCHKWSKSFLEAGKPQLNSDTIREASSNGVKELKEENDLLKLIVAELTINTRMLKKALRSLE